MNKQLLLIALVFASSQAYSRSILENSIWGTAAQAAGINVSTMYGIALQESGMRWRDGTFRPWPWTLNVNVGRGAIKAGSRHYGNKRAAALALKRLIRYGIRNVDVGLMQVNLYWHGDRVKDELDLLDPTVNIMVAALYLKEINTTNIHQTVSDYHAPSNPVLGNAYANHVKRYEKIIHATIH
ncbi:MAG: transglycosylase SLT domain-containing protein [Methyloglobulus sp.]|nr:transglycosylase SLT domain-containing protein [Methyloglobulus sp.]